MYCTYTSVYCSRILLLQEEEFKQSVKTDDLYLLPNNVVGIVWKWEWVSDDAVETDSEVTCVRNNTGIRL